MVSWLMLVVMIRFRALIYLKGWCYAYSRQSTYLGTGAYFFFEKQPDVQNKTLIWPEQPAGLLSQNSLRWRLEDDFQSALRSLGTLMFINTISLTQQYANQCYSL